jgi:hypothetical protein
MMLLADSRAADPLPQADVGVPVRPLPTALAVVADDAWEASVASFDGVCQEQLPAFVRNRWPGLAHEPVLFSAGGEIVGGSLVMIQHLPLRAGAIAITKWAPMLKRADGPDALAAYAGMIEALVAEYAQRRKMMLSVLAQSSLGAEAPEYDYLLRRGFRAGAGTPFAARYVVRLRLSDEEQRKSFEQKWRYHLNKSEKAGLSFERGGPEGRGEFDALYELMVDRKKFADHSAYETVPALLAMQNEALRPELFFVRHGGEIIAGAIIFKAGDRAVYLYGATAARALPLRAGYFLHWNIIRWLRDNTRANWYDLGGTDGFQGLHQFKKGMVGSAGVITELPRAANYAAYAVPRLIGEAAFAAREGVRTAGRFVTRLRADRARPDQRQPARDATGER